MRARYARAFIVALSLMSLTRSASAWDWQMLFALRDDAEIVPSLELGASAVLPLSTLPNDVHGFGGRLGASVHYLDDDKMALFEIVSVDFHSVYRSQRNRYDVGSFPTLALFDLSSQVRLRPGIHLLYGAGLARSGPMAHAASAVLTYRLGFALPFAGRQAETMREYRRAYLQLETLPLVGSFLTNVMQEGYFDYEAPTLQVQTEVALVGRLQTIIGTFAAETRLSASYMSQRSMYLRFRLRWTGHTFWRRLAGVIVSEYSVPLRPLRGHVADDAERLVYNHHLTTTIGLLIYLSQPPRVRPEYTLERRRTHFRNRWDTRRNERLERRETRQNERLERREARQERRESRQSERERRREPSR